jgi:hypothetical protein
MVFPKCWYWISKYWLVYESLNGYFKQTSQNRLISWRGNLTSYREHGVLEECKIFYAKLFLQSSHRGYFWVL